MPAFHTTQQSKGAWIAHSHLQRLRSLTSNFKMVWPFTNDKAFSKVSLHLLLAAPKQISHYFPLEMKKPRLSEKMAVEG